MSVGLRKIPKTGQILDPHGIGEKGSGNVAPAAFRNHGIVDVMDGCDGADLELSDFRGACCFVDSGAGLIVGYAGFGLLMNMDPRAIAAVSEPVIGPMLSRPRPIRTPCSSAGVGPLGRRLRQA